VGYHELVASLRQEGEEKVAGIHRAAAAEADRIREECAAGMQALRDGYAKRLAEAVAAEEGRLAADGRRQAERIRLHAEAALMERCLTWRGPPWPDCGMSSMPGSLPAWPRNCLIVPGRLSGSIRQMRPWPGTTSPTPV